jgi:hypothetical protein
METPAPVGIASSNCCRARSRGVNFEDAKWCTCRGRADEGRPPVVGLAALGWTRLPESRRPLSASFISLLTSRVRPSHTWTTVVSTYLAPEQE